MQQELVVAVFAGLCGMLGWGLADFFAKITIDRIGDTVSLAWGHVFGTLALFVLLIVQSFVFERPLNFELSSNQYVLLIVFGVAQAIVYLFVYRGFGKGQIAVLNPLFACFSGLTALLSIVIFKEVVSGYVLIGLFLLFLGILFISTDWQAFKNKKFSIAHVPGFKEVGFATIMAAFWTLYWDKFLGGQDWLVYTFLMYSFMTLAILLAAKMQGVTLVNINPTAWKFLVLIGFFEVLAYLGISLGYSVTTNTSIVALLSGAFSLPTIIFARLFLKEKITPLQTIGSLVIVAGIMIISII
ncbi:MAG: DMT family transporter [Candidatus Doudnabacteria bacterium]|nr:DMT family transporter [Candidatus Doudnabacteria bacterium]